MWRSVAILLCLVTAVSLSAAEPIRWRTPFQPLGESSQLREKIVVSVITNDDPYPMKGDQAEPWCGAMLQRRVATLLERRPDLSDQLLFQFLPAGRPAIVTGGESRNQPARVVIAFCDEHCRLLDLCVGMPDADELQRLIEDVQETRSLRGAEGTNRTQLQRQVAARADERLPRLWKPAMEAALQAAAQIPLDAPPAADEQSRALGPLMSSERALAQLAPVYEKDVSIRFGLTQQEDWVRLEILEQHAETRREWCEAVLPALVDFDWELIWHPTVASIWRHPPFRRQSLDPQLLVWFERQIAQTMVPLAIGENPLQAYDSLLQLVSSETQPRESSRWVTLREHIESMPLRRLSIEQLAALLSEREIAPIDLERPSPARYVIFETEDSPPLLIRTADSPSNWLRRLKRKEAAKP